MSSIATHLRDFLWHDNIETRKRFLEVVKKDTSFAPKFAISLSDERELAYNSLKTIADNKLFSVKDFKSNPKNIFAGIDVYLYFYTKQLMGKST